jgi:hypothetical protein
MSGLWSHPNTGARSPGGGGGLGPNCCIGKYSVVRVSVQDLNLDGFVLYPRILVIKLKAYLISFLN